MSVMHAQLLWGMTLSCRQCEVWTTTSLSGDDPELLFIYVGVNLWPVANLC